MRVTVETVALEDSHDTLVLHLTVFYDGFEDDFPVRVNVLQRLPGNLLQELSHREDGTRIQPAGYVIAADVIQEGIGRNRENHILQFLQVVHPKYLFLSGRITENKIPETEFLRYSLPQVNIHFLRVLVDELRIALQGIGPVRLFSRLQDKRNERITAAHFVQELDTCQRIDHSFVRITGIGNNTQGIVLVLVIQFHRLFVRACQNNLRTSAHTERTLVFVQGFGGKLLTLLQHELIQVGQDGRIETDGILYQQDHLYTHLFNIVFQVHLVLNQFDDGNQQIGISQPAEYIFKNTQVFVFHSLPDTV